MKRPFFRLAALLGITTLAAWACHDATNMVEPGGMPKRAAMNIVPAFEVATGGPVIKLAKVRAVVSVFPTGEKVVDTVANFDPTKNELQLELTVLLTEPSKQFFVKLSAIDANGDTVFKALDTLVVRQPSAATPNAATPVTIPLVYSAPDTAVKSIAIAPRDTTIVIDSILMRVKGFKADGTTEVPNVKVGWTVQDTTKARANASGYIVPRGAFTNMWVYARTALGVVDSTRLTALGSIPNLKAVALSISPAPLVPDSTVKIIFEIKNEGGPMIDTTVMRIAVTEPGTADTGDVFGIARRRIRAMQAGETIRDSISFLLPPNATPDSSGLPFNLNLFIDCKDRVPYTTLEVDGDIDDDTTDTDDNDPNFAICRDNPATAGSITETNETDNRLKITFDLKKPELEIISMTMSPTVPQRTDTATVIYTIRNNAGDWVPRSHFIVGFVDTTATNVVLAVDARQDSASHTNTLTDTVKLFIPNSIIPVGKKYRLYGYVDCTNFSTTPPGNSPETRLGTCLTTSHTGEIPEGAGGESNNYFYIGGVEIKAPDLTLLAPPPSDTLRDIAISGSTISFVFSPKNLGGHTGNGVRLLTGMIPDLSTTPTVAFDTLIGPLASTIAVGYARSFIAPSVTNATKYYLRAYFDCSITGTGTTASKLETCLIGTPGANGTIPESQEGNNTYSDSIYVVPSSTYGVTNKVWLGKVNSSWTNSGNWLNGSVPSSNDTIFIAKIAGGSNPQLSAGFAGNIIVMAPGSKLDLGGHFLHITKALIADTIMNGTVQIDGSADFRGVLPNLRVMNAARLIGKTIALGSAKIVGAGAKLQINSSRLYVGSTFKTDSSGVLEMTSSADTVEVQDSVTFAGGSETGKLTAGVLKVGGHFTTTDYMTAQFAPTGTHKTVFSGTTQNVLIGDTGVGSHFFNKIDVSGGTTVNFNTLVKIKGSSTVSGVASFSAGAVIESDVLVTGSGSKIKTDTLTTINLKGSGAKIDLSTNGSLENDATIICKEDDGVTNSSNKKMFYNGGQVTGNGNVSLACDSGLGQ